MTQPAIVSRHHNAPPLAERLEIDHASLWTQAHEVLGLEALDPIMGDDDLEAYSVRAKTLKGVGAMVEKARKGEKDQINKNGRTVEDFFAKLAKPLKDAADGIVAQINAWQRKKLEEERERQRIEAERVAAEATPFDETPPPAPPPVQAAARIVNSATGKVTASIQRKWVGEVIDFDKIPREWLMVNDTRVKAAIAGGVREIPGFRIFEDVRTAIR